MKAFAKVDPAPDKTIIVIGCNKGADAVDLFSLFDNVEEPFDSTVWRDAVKAYGVGAGACKQITQSPDWDRKIHDDRFNAISPMVYCVEPMTANVRLLESCSVATGISDDFFKIEQYAVGNPEEPGTTISFPNARAGTEDQGVIASGWIKVPYTSLDTRFGHLDTVDILTIDTEGNDPDTIFGAKHLLSKTRYLEFEVHRDLAGTAWGRHTLKSVINFLDELSFDCFWVNGKSGLFQITNCWSPLYEEEAHTWSNVVCAQRGDSWHDVLVTTHATQNSPN